ncbi:MAG: twin-arginine translocase TatA/TatE family subunit [Nitrososphaerota archaeon]|nr:twin-arginine translocase TatA/TatE family subunit [Nitrososphaerota archaeon]MDG7023317.1 twin-arginine translocase TatA/TatE family subunit [Nitrososphaerota archaeon]
MAFGDPLQWIIIGVVVVVIFLWGPQKIPELARGLGRAKKEFEAASKEASDMADAITKPSASSPAVATSPPAPERSSDQVLVETARKLGIATEGKTRDQISQEIVAKAGTQ